MAICTSKISKNIALVVAFASVFCCAFLFGAPHAYAATLEELEAKVDEAVAAYDEVTAKVNELQAQIDENQAKVDEINAKLPALQEAASVSVRSLYKIQQSSPGLVSLLLSSESLSEFITTCQYINALQRSNVDAINELSASQLELKAAQAELEASKSEVEIEQAQAKTTLQEAENALDELNQQLAAQAAAEAAAAAAQAAAEAAQNGDSAASSNEGTSSVTEQPSNPAATDGSEVSDDGTWMTGYASGYSLADNTGWDATASGEKLTDDSLTVAVPASQSYLLGRSVEIRWNGITITARVNDTGGFAKYGRVLDLAGGCWKAFGFSSARDWGVRSVQYRFL